jgi:hypothetical protein
MMSSYLERLNRQVSLRFVIVVSEDRVGRNRIPEHSSFYKRGAGRHCRTLEAYRKALGAQELRGYNRDLGHPGPACVKPGIVPSGPHAVQARCSANDLEIPKAVGCGVPILKPQT